MLGASLAHAQWELDNDKSHIHFVSIKNGAVGEVHSFTSLVGYIGEEGNANVAINLDSVETLIPIRNERMREMLFETARFPAAQVSAQVDPALLGAAAEGGVITTELPVQLSLHGMDVTVNASLVVVGEGDGHIRVFSAQPLLLNATDFGLQGGVEALREVAGLQSISTAVPVTLQLSFIRPGQ
jgi:hypothetical protein